MTQNRLIAVQAYPAPSSEGYLLTTGIMILPEIHIYPGISERSSRWFSEIQPVASHSSQTTAQFLGTYPLNQSFRTFIESQIVQHLPKLDLKLPSQSEIAANIPLDEYQHLFETPGFSMLELPESPTFADILAASNNRVRFHEDVHKKRETLLLHLSSSHQEWLDNRTAATHAAYLDYQDKFNSLPRLNDEDVDNFRRIDTFSRRILSDATDREKDRIDLLKRNHANDCHYESEMSWLRLDESIPRLLTSHILAPPYIDPHTTPIGRSSKTSAPSEDDTILQLNPMTAAEREIETNLRSRIDQVVRYTVTRIAKYSNPSRLDTSFAWTTSFERIITHTLPGLLATNDHLGLLGLSEVTINSRRQEALAVVALLADPSLLTERDRALLRTKLPFTQNTSAIDAIIDRHRLTS